MTYLLDTNVISELRKSEQRGDQLVRSWARAQHLHTLHLSVITVMELEIGIARVDRRDPRQGQVLREWLLERVLQAFGRRILSVDVPVARQSAAFHVPDPRPERDALIAATAAVHGLVVVTRNESDFAPMGLPVLNPWLGPQGRGGRPPT